MDLLADGEVVATSHTVTEDGVHIAIHWEKGERLPLPPGPPPAAFSSGGQGRSLQLHISMRTLAFPGRVS